MWRPLSDGLEDEFQRGTTPFRGKGEPPTKRARRDCDERIGKEKQEDEFKWYSRQRDALEESDRVGAMSRIFTEEDKKIGNGARKYLVTTVDRFWKDYCTWNDKHHYELITDNEKCRLFFDLEFSREVNKDVDEKRCLDHFIDGCIELLLEMYGISTTRRKFLLLDSSSPSKFSMHITVHLPLLFPSAVSIRPFAERLRSRLLVHPPLSLKNVDGTEEIVIFDLTVYTRNRNFRLFLSSKKEKGIPLVRSQSCSFYPKEECPSAREIFFDSLCVPVDWRDREVIQVEKKEEENARQRNTKYNLVNLREGISSPSPFPSLDQFVLTILSKWKSNESIRKWTLEGEENDPSSITYYPLFGRFCFNIGRNHKSNGTYWRVDLQRGTMVQRCFDVDCKGKSSNPFPIPSIVMNSLRKIVMTPVSPSEENREESRKREEDPQLITFYDQWDTLFES